MIYFDHAASSYPKPKAVGEAMIEAVNEYAANPGRGGHQLAERAGRVIQEARNELAAFFNAPNGKHVWFYQNATMALNQAISGFPFEEGDHIVTTAFEHNSVLRPLHQAAKLRGISVTYIQPDEDGIISIDEMREAAGERTKAIIVSHASNVTGAIVPLKEVKQIAEEVGAILIVDASQTAGTLSIDMERDGIDLLAFAGHKSLLGPQGTGVLISKHDYQLEPLMHGGTGSYSESSTQPSEWPDRYEAGTLNTPGIAGLLAALKDVKKRGIDEVYQHEQNLLALFLEGLRKLETAEVFGPAHLHQRLAVCSFRLKEVESHELAFILDEHYGMAVRAGLHCAPMTHHALETVDTGLVRVSFGPYNTEDEVKQLVEALIEIEQAF
ncbi:aminotransferase required for NAD biosynthesis (NifS protein) [Alkalihalophilus pseudofirmus OF4]|uniref:cysteine desulfurase n=1 Tax=Alkalihalophilus pseudofirmus (strain ATCC BAA-2126 / JCM 17055 / OF4) TaxID=398511 RepID=D3FQG6_ALKPO|nr:MULTISPECIES: aminotransferase class V-fold PLP-dependent enzyme [Alkalihalophilus]ADC49638.1 aminotransferase required for NAD biosynthesis (NifS protein) [Alkalihalophilus pseudofirmus OF4]MED1600531.1 aminotransferase class V-fold PLP-dependent enzyme [Alkalihalophilus marmarensis]